MFLLHKSFVERPFPLFHLFLFTSQNPSSTAPNSFFSRRRIRLNRTQNSFNLFLSLDFSCRHLLTLKHNVYTRSNGHSISFSKTERQNNYIGRHWKLLLLNCRMISHCCVICSSLLLETFPPAVILLFIDLSNQQLNLNLTLSLPLTLTLSQWTLHLLLMMSPWISVLSRRPLWHQPEQKQLIPQVPVFSFHSTHKRQLEPRCRISHQDFLNLKTSLLMK